jgi:hypothetical protein
MEKMEPHNARSEADEECYCTAYRKEEKLKDQAKPILKTHQNITYREHQR